MAIRPSAFLGGADGHLATSPGSDDPVRPRDERSGAPPRARPTWTPLPPPCMPPPQTVDALLDALAHPHDDAIRLLRALVLGVDPAVREEVKWNAPSFRTTGDFATMHLRGKQGVQLVLHFGAAKRPDPRVRETLADPAGLLEWKSPDRAVVALRDAADVRAKSAALGAVLRQWIAHV